MKQEERKEEGQREEHSAEEQVLLETEIEQLRINVNKAHRSEKDWAAIRYLIKNKRLYTIQPAEKERMKQFCVEGVLEDEGALMVFTNTGACMEFAGQHPITDMQTHISVVTLPFEHVIGIADDYEMGVCIDRKRGVNEQFLYYNGKTKSIHVYLMQKN